MSVGLSEAGWEAGAEELVVGRGHAVLGMGMVTMMLLRLRLLGAVTERVMGREGWGEIEAVAVGVAMVVTAVMAVVVVVD